MKEVKNVTFVPTLAQPCSLALKRYVIVP